MKYSIVLLEEDVTTKPLGHCPILGLELVHYIKLMESKLFGLTKKNVIEIAFILA